MILTETAPKTRGMSCRRQR